MYLNISLLQVIPIGLDLKSQDLYKKKERERKKKLILAHRPLR